MKCDFCGKEIKAGTGKMLVMNVGKVFNVCSSKCEKHLTKFKRTPGSLKWGKK